MPSSYVPSFQVANGIRDKIDYAVMITVIGDSATYKVFGMDSRRIGEIERVVELLRGVGEGLKETAPAVPVARGTGCWPTMTV